MGYIYKLLEDNAERQIRSYVTDSSVVELPNVLAIFAILRQAYGDIDPVETAINKLYETKLANRLFEVYVADFQYHAAAAQVTGSHKMILFKKNMSQEMKNLLIQQIDPPTEFSSYLELAMKLHNNYKEANKNARTSANQRRSYAPLQHLLLQPPLPKLSQQRQAYTQDLWISRTPVLDP
ncbi:hypothetical protein N7G274_001220 [Stereocaulon virgatum]|uniref:Uncharacterized protein n=1 Tax=Stereocaulon virgatum TaxID=373712 RepID=A0ABR4ANU1_9LECA